MAAAFFFTSRLKFFMRQVFMRALALLTLLVAIGSLSAPAQVDPAIYSLLQQHKFVEAETTARAELAIKPNDCLILTLLGLAQRGQSKLDEAFRSFQSANQSCPRNLASLEGAAEIAYSQRMPEADGLLKRVMELQARELACPRYAGGCRGTRRGLRGVGDELCEGERADRPQRPSASPVCGMPGHAGQNEGSC
jgi:cytochrome c-type biogenesis protein CcmH/NrfG